MPQIFENASYMLLVSFDPKLTSSWANLPISIDQIRLFVPNDEDCLNYIFPEVVTCVTNCIASIVNYFATCVLTRVL